MTKTARLDGSGILTNCDRASVPLYHQKTRENCRIAERERQRTFVVSLPCRMVKRHRNTQAGRSATENPLLQ